MMNNVISKVSPATEWVQDLARAAEVTQTPAAAGHARQFGIQPTTVRSVRLALGRGQHVWLRAKLATHLTGVSGVAWITFQRGADDLVLLPGQSFVVAIKTTVLIGPLQGPAQLDARGAFEITDHEESGAGPSGNRH